MFQYFALLCVLLLPTTNFAADYGKRRASSGTATPVSNLGDNDMHEGTPQTPADSQSEEDEEVASITSKMRTASTSPAKRRPQPGRIDWDKPYCATTLAARADGIRTYRETGLNTSPQIHPSSPMTLSPTVSASVASDATPTVHRVGSVASNPTPLSATRMPSTVLGFFNQQSFFEQ